MDTLSGHATWDEDISSRMVFSTPAMEPRSGREARSVTSDSTLEGSPLG